MNTAKIYYDINGNERTIFQMVKHEPHWAANRIQEGEKAIARLEALQSLPLHPTVDEWEKAIGEKLGRFDPVWMPGGYNSGAYQNRVLDETVGVYWYLRTYHDVICKYEDYPKTKAFYIKWTIVAIPGKGKPPADWRPK